MISSVTENRTNLSFEINDFTGTVNVKRWLDQDVCMLLQSWCDYAILYTVYTSRKKPHQLKLLAHDFLTTYKKRCDQRL